MSDRFNYTIRESTKAQNVSLRISIETGLEVVIPKGYDRRQIPMILQKKQAWLQKATQKIETKAQEKQRFLQSHPPNVLPEHIYLTAIDQDWQLVYPLLGSPTANKPNWQEKPHNQLIINSNSPEICRMVLRKWLIFQAQAKLIPLLHDVSKSIDLPFRKATIRNQKTLWASCSNHKDISLNCKLLFLSRDLVDYVLIHELCHTIYMNHSSNFWHLVATKSPNFKQLDHQVNDVWKILPAWIRIE